MTQPKIKAYLTKYAGEIQAALPAQSLITPERFQRIVLTEFRRNPGLEKCDPISVFGAVVQCAQLGLEPGGAQQQAHLVPYGRECTLILGYNGMVALCNRAGVHVFPPIAVFEGDTFDWNPGENSLTHKIGSGPRVPQKLVAVYVNARVPGSTDLSRMVMYRAELDEVMARSPSAKNKSSPWKTDFIAMCLKTAIRRLFKYVPSASEEMLAAANLDELGESGASQKLGSLIDAEYEHVADEAPEPKEKKTTAEMINDHLSSDPGSDEPSETATLEELKDKLGMSESPREIGLILKLGESLPQVEYDELLEHANKVADKMNNSG